MTEETQNVTTEPVVEPVSIPEPVIETLQAPEPITEPQITEPASTAQPVEPLNPEPISEPEPDSTTSPQATPEPQPVIIPPIISKPDSRSLLVKAREMIQFRKRKKLEKVMGLFLKKAEITNDDVQKLLYVSDATATRYLEQLEKEGKIKQTGTGKAISYSRM